MFSVLKQLESGEFVHVASRDDLQEAVQLAHSLNIQWPGEYEVWDSHSEVVTHLLTPGQEFDPR
ncbi:MAG TPA: hypothetical protein VJW94_14825 [Candidatus Acidoferrum sp.]|nr:hypothetical protein [Candidatus Acidoferrum sp.]